MSVLAVVQARTGSTRLPEKVLADFGDRPMLRFMLERLAPLEVDELVVATSDRPGDDRVESVALSAGVACVRGSEEDVLGRFALALRHHRADAVVRLTADCPLMDPAVVNRLISMFQRAGVDYASNTLVRTYPDGLDVEMMTAEALEAADREATDTAEREHVTPFIFRRPGRFRLAVLRQERPLGHERWTVDTPADLERVRMAVRRLQGRTDAPWEEILEVLGSSPPPVAPLQIFKAEDIDGIRRIAQQDPLLFGSIDAEPGSLTRLLNRSLDDPSVRAWTIRKDNLSSGAVVVEVDDGTGEVGLLLARHRESRLSILGIPLQAALSEDLQVCRLVLRGPLGDNDRLDLRAGGYHRDQAVEIWDRTPPGSRS